MWQKLTLHLRDIVKGGTNSTIVLRKMEFFMVCHRSKTKEPLKIDKTSKTFKNRKFPVHLNYSINFKSKLQPGLKKMLHELDL